MSNGNVLWALTDHLGNVRDVVDNSGTVLNHIVYDAFGGVTSQSNASVVFRYGYTARELDAESGLQYNRARYLDSFTGKFISEDPISFQGGDSNLYRYVFNSPHNRTDPSGKTSDELKDLLTNYSTVKPDKNSIYQYNITAPDYDIALITATNWFYSITIQGSRSDDNSLDVPDYPITWLLDAPLKGGLGKSALRPVGRSGNEPTIDLQKDRKGNRHSTPGHEKATEIKFRWLGIDKQCPLPRPKPPLDEEEYRRRAKDEFFPSKTPEPVPATPWWKVLKDFVDKIPPIPFPIIPFPDFLDPKRGL